MEEKSIDEKVVIRQDWEESERGWGVRPDGCSLHLSQADCERFINQYWDRMPDYAPDEYERPSGQPYQAKVTEEVYARISGSENGIRLYRHAIDELEDQKLVEDVGSPRKAWVRVK